MSNTISPVVDAEGNYVGSEVETRSEGLWKQDQGYIELEDGRTVNAFADAELDNEEQGGFNEAEYLEALVDSVGGQAQFNAMTTWAAQTQSPDVIQWFNTKLDGDLNDVNEAIAWLCNQYSEDNSTPTEEDTTEDETPSEIESWYENEVSPEEFQQEYESLSTATYSPEQVNQMVSMANQLPSDSVEFAVLAAGAAIANGSVSFEDAFEQLTDAYGEAHVAYAYRTLQSHLNY